VEIKNINIIPATQNLNGREIYWREKLRHAPDDCEDSATAAEE